MYKLAVIILIIIEMPNKKGINKRYPILAKNETRDRNLNPNNMNRSDSSRAAVVLKRNHRIYAAAHSAIREGRKLSTDEMIVVIDNRMRCHDVGTTIRVSRDNQ